MIGLSSGINADGSIGDGDERTSLSQRSKIESRGNREVYCYRGSMITMGGKPPLGSR
jgi:hypothetical protein